MYILNLSNPYTIIGALMATIAVIILGREFKKSLVLAIGLGIFLTLISIHTFQLAVVEDAIYKTIVTRSITVETIMIFLLYISYLWIDDIEAKEKNRKSIDNSLDWFWKKVG